MPTQEMLAGGVKSSYSGYSFDATAAVGLAACASTKAPLTVEDITAQEFTGISGAVRFSPQTYSRPGQSALYSLENVAPGPNATDAYELVGVWTAASGIEWDGARRLTFYDGSTTAPGDGVVAFLAACRASPRRASRDCL